MSNRIIEITPILNDLLPHSHSLFFLVCVHIWQQVVELHHFGAVFSVSKIGVNGRKPSRQQQAVRPREQP